MIRGEIPAGSPEDLAKVEAWLVEDDDRPADSMTLARLVAKARNGS